MENKHLLAIGGFGLLILLMILLVFQSVNTPKIGEDISGLNLNNTQPTAPLPQVTELSGQDLIVGTSSAAVTAGDTITVHYKGAFLDGKIFDSSYDRQEPFTVVVGAKQVIPGFEQGVVGMRVGGKRKLIIPSNLAYGEKGVGPIPPNTPLIFEIELLEIKSKETPTPSPDPNLIATESATPSPEP